MSKSIASTMSYLSTSYEDEIQDVRAKIAYWDSTASNHSANGFHIMAALYREYAKKAVEELSALLIKNQELTEEKEQKTITYFRSNTKCPSYSPILPLESTKSYEPNKLSKSKEAIEVEARV